MDRDLLEAISILVREVHPETLDRLLSMLMVGSQEPAAVRLWSLDLPQRNQREAVSNFASKWGVACPMPSRQLVVGAILGQRFAEETRTEAEICWSGPVDTLQGFRTTSAAYSELMSTAERSVLILTFSIGEVELLSKSLESAIERNVAVRLILEDFDVFAQEARRHKFELFGRTVLDRASVYVWPTEKRRTQEGRIFGSMHVKCVVVDETALLLTSANWSGAAMQDNMELGVVIRDRETVCAVVRHFDHLIASDVLVRALQ